MGTTLLSEEAEVLEFSSTNMILIYATAAVDEVTSKELVMNVRQRGQCNSTAKQPLHTHVCLHGNRARSMAED